MEIALKATERDRGGTIMSKQADRICEILRSEPNGLSAREVARLLGASSKNINSRLSKLAAYGLLHKIPGRTGSNIHRCAMYSILETTS